MPLVVCPLGIEPKKPRGLWDGRYVNEFCRDIPFTMDNAAKVAECLGLKLICLNLTTRMVISMFPYMKAQGNSLESVGKAFIMSSQFSLLAGNQAH